MSFYGIYADLAHLVERHLAKVEVASSSLVIRSKIRRGSNLGVFYFSLEILKMICYNLSNADLAHLVERHLPKVDVASSSLVIRSK